MKKKSIKVALLIPVIAVLAAGVLVMVSVIGVRSSKIANELSEKLVMETVRHYAKSFDQIVSKSYEVVDTLTPVIVGVPRDENARVEVTNQMIQVMQHNEGIFGLWSAWEPNAFDGKDEEYAGQEGREPTGRFMPFVHWKDGQIVYSPLLSYDDPVKGEYYQGVKTTGKHYITDPFYRDVNGEDVLVISIAVPVIKDGKFLGAVGADVNMEPILEAMNSASILEDGYVLTFSPSGYVTTHRSAEQLMTHYDANWMSVFDEDFKDVAANGGEKYFSVYSEARKENVMFTMKGVKIGETGRYWNVCGIIPQKTVDAPAIGLLAIIITVGIALIVVVSLTIFLIITRLLRGLPVLTQTARHLAGGEIELVDLGNVDHSATKNELSLLTQAFDRMVSTIRGQVETVQKIAEGDLTVDVNPASEQDKLNMALDQMVTTNNNIFSEIVISADSVNTGAQQLAAGAQVLAQSSMEQTATIEQLSAAINEIAEKTRTNEDMAVRAAEVSSSIRQSAQEGSGQIEQMLTSVREINEASGDISKVIKVIEDIAFQTNILALNAAVEAARAGQHGRGFAVVADEVRNLASKSADAAKETSVLISNSAEKAMEGMKFAENASDTFTNILAGISETNELVEQIPPASKEQRVTIEQVSIGIQQVTATIQQNSATAEESAASSETMSGQSNLMHSLVSRFKLKPSATEDANPEAYSNAPASEWEAEPDAGYYSGDCAYSKS